MISQINNSGNHTHSQVKQLITDISFSLNSTEQWTWHMRVF